MLYSQKNELFELFSAQQDGKCRSPLNKIIWPKPNKSLVTKLIINISTTGLHKRIFLFSKEERPELQQTMTQNTISYNWLGKNNSIHNIKTFPFYADMCVSKCVNVCVSIKNNLQLNNKITREPTHLSCFSFDPKGNCFTSCRGCRFTL